VGTTGETLSVVRAYHRAWTSKNFDEAVRLLAPNLEVEVPINDYPTTESFSRSSGRLRRPLNRRQTSFRAGRRKRGYAAL
jgi:hypothetical protein